MRVNGKTSELKVSSKILQGAGEKYRIALATAYKSAYEKFLYEFLSFIEWDNVLLCPSVIGTTQVIFSCINISCYWCQ